MRKRKRGCRGLAGRLVTFGLRLGRENCGILWRQHGGLGCLGLYLNAAGCGGGWRMWLWRLGLEIWINRISFKLVDLKMGLHGRFGNCCGDFR